MWNRLLLRLVSKYTGLLVLRIHALHVIPLTFVGVHSFYKLLCLHASSLTITQKRYNVSKIVPAKISTWMHWVGLSSHNAYTSSLVQAQCIKKAGSKVLRKTPDSGG